MGKGMKLREFDVVPPLPLGPTQSHLARHFSPHSIFNSGVRTSKNYFYVV